MIGETCEVVDGVRFRRNNIGTVFVEVAFEVPDDWNCYRLDEAFCLDLARWLNPAMKIQEGLAQAEAASERKKQADLRGELNRMRCEYTALLEEFSDKATADRRAGMMEGNAWKAEAESLLSRCVEYRAETQRMKAVVDKLALDREECADD